MGKLGPSPESRGSQQRLQPRREQVIREPNRPGSQCAENGFQAAVLKAWPGDPESPPTRESKRPNYFHNHTQDTFAFSVPFFCEPTVEFLSGYMACVIKMDWMQKQMRVQLPSLEPNIEKRFSQKAKTAPFCLVQ